MKPILNVALNHDLADILAMNITDLSEVYKSKVGGHSIEIVESPSCISSYTYKHEEDRDADFETLTNAISNI